tara:strand:+ start:13281 stop:13385 length:105 start_codon:yes stop_codon:yes gene_type:complete
MAIANGTWHGLVEGSEFTKEDSRARPGDGITQKI